MIEDRKQIIAFHLYNDYSGSPKVLCQVLGLLSNDGYKIDLITSRGGILDSLNDNKNISIHYFRYKFYRNLLVRTICFLCAQLSMFFLALMYGKDKTFYINTIMPVSSLFAAKILKSRTVCHVHENISKSTIYQYLESRMEKSCNSIICVSDYQRSFIKRKNNVFVVPNCLSIGFFLRLTPHVEKAFKDKNILFVGSLKKYKGINALVKIAARLPEFKFTAVINDTEANIKAYFKAMHLPINLKIFPRSEDLVPYYNSASMLLNLSIPSVFIETFGLTVLEAMSCALPVIVPPVGGVAEIVEDGYNGYHFDASKDVDNIVLKIIEIFSSYSLYKKLSQNALSESEKYKEAEYIKNIETIL